MPRIPPCVRINEPAFVVYFVGRSAGPFVVAMSSTVRSDVHRRTNAPCLPRERDTVWIAIIAD
jgi:hypothetical protein